MRWALAIVLFPSFVACASGGDDSAAPGSEAGADTTVEDATAYPDQSVDQRAAPDSTIALDTGSPEAGSFDGGSGDAQSADASGDGGPPDAGCGTVGQPCSTTNPFSCPFAFPNLFVCTAALDAGPSDGVCLSAMDTSPSCINGQCPAGQACLTASMICLTPQETQCVCNNPQESAACGPQPTDGGAPDGDASDGAIADAGADAPGG